MSRRVVLSALALAVAIAVCLGALRAWHRPAATTVSHAAAEDFFKLYFDDADGVRRALSAWRGKKLLVNFWASWCAPCVEEMPQLQALADDFRSSNVAVIGIGVDQADNVRQFRKQHKIRFDLLVAGFEGMELAQRLGNPQPILPYTVLIGPDGAILEQYSGRIDPAELRRRLAADVHGAVP